jgi:hypothetical protein
MDQHRAAVMLLRSGVMAEFFVIQMQQILATPMIKIDLLH